MLRPHLPEVKNDSCGDTPVETGGSPVRRAQPGMPLLTTDH
jgi:hypothetical protein